MNECFICKKETKETYSNKFSLVNGYPTYSICKACSLRVHVAFKSKTNLISGTCVFRNQDIQCSSHIYYTHQSFHLHNKNMGVCENHANEACNLFTRENIPPYQERKKQTVIQNKLF